MTMHERLADDQQFYHSDGSLNSLKTRDLAFFTKLSVLQLSSTLFACG